jgi:putative ABC transport system permease protein
MGILVQDLRLSLMNVDPGFRTERVLAFPLSLPQASYDSDSEVRSFYDQLLDGIRRLPGVESAGAVYRLPLASPGSGNSFRIEGRPPPAPGEKEYMEVRPASPDYFRSLGVPLLRGRAIGPQDRQESVPVVVINEAAADRYFPGEDPLGRRIDFGWSRLGGPREVVGVVGNVRHFGLANEPYPEAYFPLAQTPMGAMNVVVRTAGDPLGLAAAVRREVHALDPNLPVPEFQTMEQVVSASAARPRFLAVLLSLFAGVALALAAIGIFGLLSYAVAQRTREIGIRMALGAEPGGVVGTVLRRALVLVAAGLGLGIAGALALTRLLQSMLFGVSPADPYTLVGVVLLLGATGLLAGLVPARRAAAVEPLVALRHE